MLSHIRGNDRISLGCLVNRLDHIGACQSVMIICKRIFFLQLFYFLNPLLMIQLLQTTIQSLQHLFYISDDAGIHHHILVNLCRIHIDLYDLSIFRKTTSASHHSVTEPGTNRDQKVAGCHAKISGLGPMHSNHSAVQLFSSIICTLSHKGVCHRSVYFFYKLFQFLRCI